MRVWDPIEVADVPTAASEYDNYFPAIIRELAADGTSESLARVLGRLRTEEMGLPPKPEVDRVAATEIVRWYLSLPTAE